MNDFYIDNLINADLQNIVKGYREMFKKLVGPGTKGMLGIRNWTININGDESWAGARYNNVVNFWNETTSPELYKLLQEYYNYFAIAQNIADIYSGLEDPIGGTDVGGSAEISDEEYKVLNNKLKLTNSKETKFKEPNVEAFQKHVAWFGERELEKSINELNLYVEENLKDKSTTLDILIEKVKNANANFLQRAQALFIAYNDCIEKNIGLVKNSEEANIGSVNNKM